MAALSEDSCLTVVPRPRPSHRDKVANVALEEETPEEEEEPEIERVEEIEQRDEEERVKLKNEHVPEIETIKEVYTNTLL